jgi:hypothetical protein
MVSMYSPLGEIRVAEAKAISAMPSMAGATIAVIDNSKHNFRALMDLVRIEVDNHFADINWYYERKPGAAHPMADDLRDRVLSHASVVFTGSGD